MKVKFDSATDAQVNFGGGKDPRKHLEIGKTYEVTETEVHSWYTLYYIDVEGKPTPFNSVCFTEETEQGD